jgi:hypothetical protein
LLDFAQRANQLFQDADTATKNKALRFINANSMLYDKTLSIKLINTYKAFKELNDNGITGTENANWCKSLCNQLTSKATELEQDIAFQELVDVLQLNGGLLAV